MLAPTFWYVLSLLYALPGIPDEEIENVLIVVWRELVRGVRHIRIEQCRTRWPALKSARYQHHVRAVMKGNGRWLALAICGAWLWVVSGRS